MALFPIFISIESEFFNRKQDFAITLQVSGSNPNVQPDDFISFFISSTHVYSENAAHDSPFVYDYNSLLEPLNNNHNISMYIFSSKKDNDLVAKASISLRGFNHDDTKQYVLKAFSNDGASFEVKIYDPSGGLNYYFQPVSLAPHEQSEFPIQF